MKKAIRSSSYVAGGFAIALATAACGQTAVNTSGGGGPALSGPSASAAVAAANAASTKVPRGVQTNVTVPMDPTEIDKVGFMSVGVIGGKVAALYGSPKVKLGEIFVVKVFSDATSEVHIHGYNILRTVKANVPLAIPFRANIPGQFVVELEQTHTELFTFQVS
jgi:hypothetical protein